MRVRRVRSFSLFRTKLFRESAWIKQLCARRPYMWVWENPPARPAGHFGTYFGATTAKAYDNQYISDLYYLHELTHTDTIRYDPTYSFKQWVGAVIDSELLASLTSECFSHVHIKGLRKKTFKHEIWVDRFLKAAEKRHTQATELFISAARLRAVQAPEFDDILENQVKNYYDQNFEWCRVWSEPVGYGRYAKQPAFRVVERHMSDPHRDKNHLAWLKAVSAKNPHGNGVIPFLNQALAFEPIYQATSAKFGNGIFLR